MRHTSGHTRNRRSHHALKNQKVVTDKQSGKLRLPHRLDESTGRYRGKLIVTPKVKKVKEPKKKGPAEGHVHMEKEAEEPKKKGILGRLSQGRAKARSGMGGGA